MPLGIHGLIGGGEPRANDSFFVEDFEGVEGSAGHEFQAGAPAGGDVGDFVFEAGLLDSRGGVAATDDADGALGGGVGDGLGDGVGARVEGFGFKPADGPVPDDGFGRLEDPGEELDGLGSDVQPAPTGVDGAGADLGFGSFLKVFAADVVEGQDDLIAGGLEKLAGEQREKINTDSKKKAY